MRFMNPVLSQFPLTRWPLLMAGGSLMLLLGAWIFQYGFGYEPCALCYDQRYIHMAVIALGLASGGVLIIKPTLARFAPWTIFAVAAVLLWSAGFAFWHAGIEYDWWAGPASCTTGGNLNFDPASLMDVLDGTTIPAMCDEASWRFIGISMAGYNAMISAVMASISIFVGYKGLKG
jgi:disulfide bond formation protein DsbB